MPPRKVKDEQSPMKYITRSSNKNPLKKIKLEKTQTQTIDKNEINYINIKRKSINQEEKDEEKEIIDNQFNSIDIGEITEKSEEKMNFIYQTKNNQKDNNSITEIEKELKQNEEKNYENFQKEFLEFKEQLLDLRNFENFEIPIKFKINDLELIKQMYLNLIKYLDFNNKELPSLYYINKNYISINYLQKDRFEENNFLYYFTDYRKKKYIQILNLFNKEESLELKLTGLQASGKSHFLADFVLRNRLKIDQFRFLYINNSYCLTLKPITFIANELKSMLCFDLSENFDETLKLTIKPPQNENFKCPFINPITQWLFYFHQHTSFGDDIIKLLIDFMFMIKEYFDKKQIKLVLVWDQINMIDNLIEQDDIKKLFKRMCDLQNFNYIIISSSNNNITINKENPYYQVIEMDPFETFTKQELMKLIYEELKIFKSSSTKNNLMNFSMMESVYEILNLTESSLPEYCFFKIEIKFDYFYEQKIKSSNPNERFFDKRYKNINESENEYQKKNLHYYTQVVSYYENMGKILTFQEFKELIKEDEEKISAYVFSEIPKFYNKQLLYYNHEQKMLISQSSIVKKHIFQTCEWLNNVKNPWRNIETGEKFELFVQNYYLNNIRDITFEKVLVSINERNFCYDCSKLIPKLKLCLKDKKSSLFHFLQKNHFAFDSLVYDGKSKTLILIQITINEHHDINYEEILSYIKNNKETKHDVKKIKYFNFFKDLNKNKLVDTIIFQWMTDKKYEKIENSAKIYNNKIKSIFKIDFFLISPYHRGLLEDINKN